MISEIENNIQREITSLTKRIQISNPTIQADKVIELKTLDPSLVVFTKLITIFRNEYTNRIPEMKKHCANRDNENLSRVIHRFKSTTYNLGAARAVEFTKEIESAITRKSDGFYIEQLIGQLERECISAYDVLLTFIPAARS
jgi:HPt (histidine-containing phosphotransfer) domain-containing protein